MPADLAEAQDDAVVCALHDQEAAGLDVVTDGEQTRLDFNLSFYGFLEGVDARGHRRRGGSVPPRTTSAAGIASSVSSKRRAASASVQEFDRLKRLIGTPRRQGCGVTLKASVPGPYTLSGRLIPSDRYPDRWALTEALVPIVRAELEALVGRGLPRDQRRRAVDELLRLSRGSAAVRGHLQPHGGAGRRQTRLCTHLCFGNYKARAGRPPASRADVPGVSRFHVRRMHVEMASREFAEIELHRRDRRSAWTRRSASST